MNNYLSVCMFQLKVNLDCNSKEEYLIESEEFFKTCKPSAKYFPKRFASDRLSGVHVKVLTYKEGILVQAGSQEMLYGTCIQLIHNRKFDLSPHLDILFWGGYYFQNVSIFKFIKMLEKNIVFWFVCVCVCVF